MFNKVKSIIAQKFAIVALSAIVMMLAMATSASAAPVSFTGTTLPFTVPDMLGTAINFLTMYGEWILLALGVLFAPVLYSLAMKLVGAVRSKMAKA
jgi:hypothetical protein